MKASGLHTCIPRSSIESTWIYSQKDLKHSWPNKNPSSLAADFLDASVNGQHVPLATWTFGSSDLQKHGKSNDESWQMCHMLRATRATLKQKIMVHLPNCFFFLIKNSSFSSFFYRYNKKVETHDLETLRDKKKAPWPNQGASRWDSPNGLHLGPHRGDSDWSSSRDVQQWSLATRYQVRFFFCWERWRWTQVVNPKHFFFLKELVIFSFFSAGICFGNLP